MFRRVLSLEEPGTVFEKDIGSIKAPGAEMLTI